MTNEEKYRWYNREFSDLVHKQVKKMHDSYLYYEVWIDFKESMHRWFDYAFKHPNLAAYNVARWLIRRDKWYWSPTYVKQLNSEMDKNGGDAGLALVSVLNESLTK